MPYLVRQFQTPLASTRTADHVIEFEVIADSQEQAEEKVAARKPGMSTRITHDNQGRYIEPLFRLYTGISDTFLPVPLPAGPRYYNKVLTDAIRASMELNCEILSAAPDDNKEAVSELLKSIAAYARDAEPQGFVDAINNALDDRPDLYGHRVEGIFSTEFPDWQADEIRERAGKAAVSLHTEKAGIDEGDNPEDAPSVAIYHTLHSLISYCDEKNIDFAKCLEAARQEIIAEVSIRSPRI